MCIILRKLSSKCDNKNNRYQIREEASLDNDSSMSLLMQFFFIHEIHILGDAASPTAVKNLQ